ncbi:ABC transporter substrate-binding protein [Shewanella sp. C32]|uniref:ABC transporter substrate-binding protein n=1 Tax=Shewanella electrica TaxID=515560 RepID=A0ABT2FI89_9GAMM|nr:ABC transporter substrate-binding protein [Shewanella electrica]MCH1924146.1 ABC transporter substrate-binding protein [Shewanella electrica]MCS4556049.1 ABC transporter substrate-binding protein [Shewanella electrica]
MVTTASVRRACVALLLLLPASAWSAATRTIEYHGQKVTVPAQVTKVATSWEAQNSVLAMLGFGDKIVATTRYARDTPAFQKFIPSIKNTELSTAGGSAEVNVEQLMRLQPDIMFVSAGFPSTKQAQLEAAGIAVASFTANSMDTLVERVQLTGEMLGPDAAAKAKAYKTYFERNKALVAARLAKIPAEQRLKVYIASGTPLTTSGRPSLNQDWIDLAGGINIAEHWSLSDVHHGSANVSVEAILAAQPDVIISMRQGDVATIEHDPRWRNVKAVKQQRVYANPRGLFWWCRETSEEALQFLWLAKVLYPSAFADIDIRQETHDFYQQFYDIDLSDADITAFLAPVES